jgi:CubicO group peptidase (beta-lactamase class C family)/pimeloyl-ACP methyl ester carboxylesterase
MLLAATAGAVVPVADPGGPHSIQPGSSAVSSDSVDAHIRALMAQRQIPGLSLVVIKNGRIITEGHYGLANVELNVPVNENTSFMIASMSKAFTAAALMLLVDDGLVNLEDPVTNYLGDLPQTWRAITLRQLLDCTAGISNDWDLHPPGEEAYFLTHNTDEGFLRALADVPLLFTPGEAYHYAAGTFVVGMLMEKVSGVPYAEFMRTRVFEPLGMTRTMINDASLVVPHRASGYRIENGVLTHGRRISPAAEARGDVGVLTTALDLAKWDAAFRDTRLLSQSSLDAISTPARLNDGSSYPYGLGWGLWPLRGNRVMGHGGTFRTGYSSHIDRFVDDDLTVIVVTNLHGAFGDREIGAEIAGFYNPAYRLASSMTPRPDPDPERSQILRSVLGLVGSGIHDPGRLTPDFPITAYTQSRWQERHSGLKSFTFVDCEDRSTKGLASSGEAIHEVCFYHFSDAQGVGYLVYSLAQDGKVADLYAEEFVPHPQGAVGVGAAAPADLAISNVTVNGVELHYVEQGDGVPVVLIHGSLADYTYWELSDQIALLSENHRVIAYSRRYNYPNRNPRAIEHSPLVEAQDLAAFLDALDPGPVHLVGHSYGAYTALAFALDHPGRVRSLVLAEPPIISWLPDIAGGEGIFERFMAEVWKPLGEAFARSTPEGLDFTARWYFKAPFSEIDPEWQELFSRNVDEWHALAVSENAFAKFDYDRVRSLLVPALLLSGGANRGFNPLIDEHLLRLLPHAERVIIPDASHEMFLDDRVSSAAEMVSFFRRH